MTATTKKGTALVTGAHGFVGRAVCTTLMAAGYAVRALIRAPSSPHGAAAEEIVADLTGDVPWSSMLAGVQVVVHLAARTHVVNDRDDEPLAACRRINVEATRALAQAAAQAGVQRFVYMSSIKVNGERTTGHPYTEGDAPNPEDAYGISKREAEQALAAIARETGMETVILRPPLVYGPQVKGNLLALMRVLDRHVPLPLASIRNRRSLLYVGNLADAILRCIESPHAADRIYLVSDGEDWSTPELIRKVAAGMGVKPLLFPCPTRLLRAAGRLLGKRGEIDRLTGSLQVDSSRIRHELGWQPPYAPDAGLREMALWYRTCAKGDTR